MNEVYVLNLVRGGYGFSLTIYEGSNDVGRAKQCRLQIQHKSVSRWHSRITQSGSDLQIEDLESSNGTYVNGQLVEKEEKLQVGDLVRFGEVEFRLASEEVKPESCNTEAIEFVNHSNFKRSRRTAQIPPHPST
jgi:pSer/pThr/pTyr-binding forkhead associated (FHA) protein